MRNDPSDQSQYLSLLTRSLDETEGDLDLSMGALRAQGHLVVTLGSPQSNGTEHVLAMLLFVMRRKGGVRFGAPPLGSPDLIGIQHPALPAGKWQKTEPSPSIDILSYGGNIILIPTLIPLLACFQKEKRTPKCSRSVAPEPLTRCVTAHAPIIGLAVDNHCLT